MTINLGFSRTYSLAAWAWRSWPPRPSSYRAHPNEGPKTLSMTHEHEITNKSNFMIMGTTQL